jgi:glycosyltransferase involved in cell wall biosynthesis
MKTSKICILTTSYPENLEAGFPTGKFVHGLAKSFVSSGYQVHVVTHHGQDTKQTEKIEGVNIHRFHYFFPFAETLTKGYGLPENVRKVKNKLLVPFYFTTQLLFALYIIRKFKIDFIHAHWAVPTGYIGLLLKELTGRKLIITMYGAELFPVMKGGMSFLKPFIRVAVNKSDMAAGISVATVDAAKALSGRKDIYVIPDGIETDYFKPGLKNSALLKKYNCSPEDKVVFLSGRMVERKGHIYLLKAINYVKDQFPEVKLILGGKGPMEEQLLSCCKDLGLEDYVRMPGFIPEKEIVPLLQSIDLFVLPSCIDKNGDTEGSATAALEAMACGIPCIVSYVGGNIGAIEEAQGAFYFKQSNETDLAQKICGVFENKEDYDLLKTNARNYVVKNYSWSAVVKEYEAHMFNS